MSVRLTGAVESAKDNSGIPKEVGQNLAKLNARAIMLITGQQTPRPGVKGLELPFNLLVNKITGQILDLSGGMYSIEHPSHENVLAIYVNPTKTEAGKLKFHLKNADLSPQAKIVLEETARSWGKQ